MQVFSLKNTTKGVENWLVLCSTNERYQDINCLNSFLSIKKHV